MRMIQNYARQLLQSLRYCHEKGILHRDVKPSNLLLSRSNILKLADFGMAHISTEDFPLSANVVTLWYRAPELLAATDSIRYTSKVDIWSAGCVIGEMFLHTPLFPGKDPERVLSMIKENAVNTVIQTNNEVFNDFIQGLLRIDHTERFSAGEALEHMFFRW